MKTIIIIIIICSVLYCIGIGQDQPAPKAPARNRTAENNLLLRSWLDHLNRWQIESPNNTALPELIKRIESVLAFGCTAKEFTAIQDSMKDQFIKR